MRVTFLSHVLHVPCRSSPLGEAAADPLEPMQVRHTIHSCLQRHPLHRLHQHLCQELQARLQSRLEATPHTHPKGPQQRLTDLPQPISNIRVNFKSSKVHHRLLSLLPTAGLCLRALQCITQCLGHLPPPTPTPAAVVPALAAAALAIEVQRLLQARALALQATAQPHLATARS